MLDKRLAEFLEERNLVHPELPPLRVAEMIIEWLCREYDREVEEALGVKDV